MSNDTAPNRDVVVVERGGSSLGVIIGVILFGGATDQGNDINVNVELPSVAPEAS